MRLNQWFPKLIDFSIIALHPTSESVSDLIQLNNNQLKQRAREIGADTTSIDVHINARLRQCIRQHVGELNLDLVSVPLLENNGKNVANGIKTIFPAYALFKSDRTSTDQDVEAQDPMKAAIKAAIKDKEAKLDSISKFIEEQVRKIANLTLEKLKEMDSTLASTLRPQFTKPNWSSIFKVGIECDQGIPINKRGSGVRRLILLNFFRAKVEKMSLEERKLSVIYAIEEPETSQHPKNQRLIISTLLTLSDNAQVIITTHTPMLARYIPSESIRFIDVENNHPIILNGGNSEVNRRIIDSLGILPDNSVKMFIGVEGKTDIPFLKNLSKALCNDGLDVPNLEELEINGEVIFMPFGGSLLAIWTNRLQELNRPEYHIYDRDTAPPEIPKYQEYINSVNSRTNCIAVSTQKKEIENYIHYQAINKALEKINYSTRLVRNFGDFDDVPSLLSNILNQEARDGDKWGQQRVKVFLSTQAACNMTREMLNEIDPDGEVLEWFARIKDLYNIAP